MPTTAGTRQRAARSAAKNNAPVSSKEVPCPTAPPTTKPRQTRKATADTAQPQPSPDVRALSPTVTDYMVHGTETSNDEEAAAPKLVKRGRPRAATKVAPTPAEPTLRLPDRPGRNNHPGAREELQPRPRRSGSKVRAEMAARAAAAAAETARVEQAKFSLAAMHSKQRLNYEADVAGRVEELDMEVVPATPPTSSEGEDMGFVMMSDNDDSDVEAEIASALALKVKAKAKKTTKGATRKEVQQMEGKMSSGIQGGLMEGFNQPKKKAAAKRSNPKVTNQGLIEDWENRDKTVAGLGGLQDTDIEDSQPTSHPNLTRDRNAAGRENESVGLVCSPSDIPIALAAVVTKVKKSTVRAPKGSKFTKSAATAVSVSAMSSAVAPTILLSSNETLLNINSILTHPRFPVLLDCIHGALYSSTAPFVDFLRDSPVFVAICQRGFNHVFPEIDYTFRSLIEEPVVERCYDRSCEKRSKIGRAVADHVRRTLEAMHNAGQTLDVIQQHIEYCRWMHGPVYNLKPTPFDCKLPLSHPDVIRPEGFGESAIVIDLVKKYLPRAKQSMLHHGPPLGLFALIMAGLSRAYAACGEDGRLPESLPSKFSHEDMSLTISGFINNLAKFSPEKWDKIDKLLGLKIPDVHTAGGITRMQGVDVNAGWYDGLYCPSPAKQS